MFNRYIPKVSSKIRYAPKFTASDFLEKSNNLDRRLPEKAIIVFSRKLFEILKIKLELTDFSHPYNGYFEEGINEKSGVLVVKIYPGAPLAAVTVEELSSLGTSSFLMLGTAGSINGRAHFNDIVSCSRALRDEGTSYHYLKPSTFTRPYGNLRSELESRVKSSGIKMLKGPTWTTDAPYMETPEEVAEFVKHGIFTVEMEAAAVFAVSNVRKVSSAAVFAISDELHGGQWTGIMDPNEGFGKLAEIAMLYSEL